MATDYTADELWSEMIRHQGSCFQTAKGLDFTYEIRGYEMFVDRKQKSITFSSVSMAYEKVRELGGIVTGPKKLGVFGASYLYPVFVRLGVSRGGMKSPAEEPMQ